MIIFGQQVVDGGTQEQTYREVYANTKNFFERNQFGVDYLGLRTASGAGMIVFATNPQKHLTGMHLFDNPTTQLLFFEPNPVETNPHVVHNYVLQKRRFVSGKDDEGKLEQNDFFFASNDSIEGLPEADTNLYDIVQDTKQGESSILLDKLRRVFGNQYHPRVEHLYTAPSAGIIGEGGFARVDKVEDKGTYARKTFHVGDIEDEEEEQRQATVKWILQNVREKKEVFSYYPFLAPLHTSSSHNAYIMEYLDGKTVDTLIADGTISENQKASVAYTYAKMLEHMHDRGMVFFDNNWSSVIVGADELRICDYDFVDRISAYNAVFHPGLQVTTKAYASRVQLQRSFGMAPTERITQTTDIEGFALMLHRLYTGNHFREITPAGVSQLEKEVRENKRDYPVELAQLLPVHLREVLPGIIQYPRDPSITLDDIISALEHEYNF